MKLASGSTFSNTVTDGGNVSIISSGTTTLAAPSAAAAASPRADGPDHSQRQQQLRRHHHQHRHAAGRQRRHHWQLGTGGVTDNSVLIYNLASGTLTDANAFSGSGSIVKNGNNLLILSNQGGSFTGNVTINAGTIEAIGGITPTNNTVITTLGTGTVTVNSGAGLIIGNVGSTSNSYYWGSNTVNQGTSSASTAAPSLASTGTST